MEEEEYKKRKQQIEDQQRQINHEKRIFMNDISQLYNLVIQETSQNMDNKRRFQRQLNEIQEIGLKKCQQGQKQLLQSLDHLEHDRKMQEREGNDC